MSHSLVSKYYEVRSDRIKRGIEVSDMPDDPDHDDVMSWALEHIEAQRRVMEKDCLTIIDLRIALAKNGA